MWLGQASWVRTSQPDLKGACETLEEGELSWLLLKKIWAGGKTGQAEGSRE